MFSRMEYCGTEGLLELRSFILETNSGKDEAKTTFSLETRETRLLNLGVFESGVLKSRVLEPEVLEPRVFKPKVFKLRVLSPGVTRSIKIQRIETW